MLTDSHNRMSRLHNATIKTKESNVTDSKNRTDHKVKTKNLTNRMKVKSIILILLTTIVSACNSDGVYFSNFKDIDKNGWDKRRPIEFEIPDSIVLGHSDLQLSIRHDNYYPYRNIWLIVDYAKGNAIVQSDTINFQIADKYGKWYGSGLGKLFQHTASIKKNVKNGQFNKVIIWQDMRCDTITNINNIGLSLVTKAD